MMWVQSGFMPDDFWHQTPRSFQLAMKATRKRLEGEAEARIRQSWETGAFSGTAYAGKLKPLSHYVKREGGPQSPRDMLAALKTIGAGTNMKIKRVKLGN